MVMSALYLVGLGIIENGIVNVRQYTNETLDAALAGSTRLFTLAGCASIFEIVGTMALPVLAFLIIQGAEDARDKKGTSSSLARWRSCARYLTTFPAGGSFLTFPARASC